jgi:hypothetical protein
LGLYAAEIFEADRSAMARELRFLRREINDGATEMKMVAAERVFGNSLSRALIRTALKFQLIARDLTNLLRLVERAPLPQAPKRTAPKAASPLQRKKRK